MGLQHILARAKEAMGLKIKVAIVDTDENYTNHLVRNFQIHYADKLELYVFSTAGQLYNKLQSNRMDVILMDDSLEVEKEYVPEGAAFAYLCKTMDMEEEDGLPAICKFQKTEMIYKQILGIYAENAADVKIQINESLARLVLFVSAQGGSGTSAVAAAYALKCAADKKDVFYLNLELFGSPDLYFSHEGSMSFSDVIYALKSKKSNLSIKMESFMKTDKSGVDYFDTCKNAYDMAELTDKEIGLLLQGIAQMKEYEEIIIDLSGDLSERMLLLMRDYASRIICVSDGSVTGNRKFELFCEMLRVIEQREEKDILGKMALLYNHYRTKTSSQLLEVPIAVLDGIIPCYEGVAGRELVEQIAAKTAGLEQI